jgi:hypothetical protein
MTFSFPGLNCGDRGFLLLALIPLVCLLLLGFTASLEVARRSQAKIALQSRLDLCAVRLAREREETLERITELNEALHMTIIGIYAARGIAIASGPLGFALGKGAEAALLAANRSLAGAENALVALGSARELGLLTCATDAFSQEPAFCNMRPWLPEALQRAPTLFPDILGTLVHKTPGARLARAACRASLFDPSTTLALEGDGLLSKAGYQDTYEQ